MGTVPNIIRWDQAYNRNGDPKLPRAVVNAIRTHMDNHTLTGWVKATTLADYTGLKERAVRTQIAVNVKAGWLEVVESGNSSGKANTYRLTYPNHVVHDTATKSSRAGNHVVHDTPTTPTTSLGSSPKRRTTRGNGVVLDTLSPDPFGSGGIDIDRPANATTESNHVAHDRVSKDALDNTLPVPLTWQTPSIGFASTRTPWPSGMPLPKLGDPNYDPFMEYVDVATGQPISA